MSGSGPKLKFTMKENGVHSLQQGLRYFAEFERTHDQMALKESIMSTHHGIELLMKEILMKSNGYLIFEDLEGAIKAGRKAEKKGLSIFEVEDPPHTVSFPVSVDRVKTFSNPVQLDETLRTQLMDLNTYRNQIEHYMIEVDEEKVMKLMTELQYPVLTLFETEIGGLKGELSAQNIKVPANVSQMLSKFYQGQEEVAEALPLAGLKVIPAALINSDKELTIPLIAGVYKNYRIPGTNLEFDVFVDGSPESIAIDIKTGTRIPEGYFSHMKTWGDNAGAIPWSIFFTAVNQQLRNKAKAAKVLLTDEKDWTQVKKVLQS